MPAPARGRRHVQNLAVEVEILQVTLRALRLQIVVWSPNRGLRWACALMSSHGQGDPQDG